MRMVNVADVALEEGPGREGFGFRAAPLGGLLGAARIGAGLYEARAGVPIWPYHYHYPDEEWLYVLAGAPVLRDAAGRRTLAPRDLMRFAPGHTGAHTLEGPGRFVIFSGERSGGPSVSIYPDSDKVSVFPGIESGQLNALRFRRGTSVDYWQGEGEGPVPAATIVREPEAAAGPAVVNLGAPGLGSPGSPARLGARPGAGGLEAEVLALEPGADDGPFRFEHGRERWLLGLGGVASLQHAEGERDLVPGDLACLPEGPAGGRRLANHGPGSAWVLSLRTTGFPAAVCEPGTGTWVLRPAAGAADIPLREP